MDQEIRSEGLSRSIDLFARFLEVAAVCNGQQLNYAKLASDVGRSEKTVAQWFSILEDTLIGHLLPCFQATIKRKAVASPKFFFFDCGVANALLNRYSLKAGTPEYGTALENLVFTHLAATCAYATPGYKLHYWRSRDRHEVDFVVTYDRIPKFAIEVKTAETTKPEFLTGLRAFGEEFPECQKILLCRVPFRSQTEDGIDIIPVSEFLMQRLEN